MASRIPNPSRQRRTPVFYRSKAHSLKEFENHASHLEQHACYAKQRYNEFGWHCQVGCWSNRPLTEIAKTCSSTLLCSGIELHFGRSCIWLCARGVSSDGTQNVPFLRFDQIRSNSIDQLSSIKFQDRFPCVFCKKNHMCLSVILIEGLGGQSEP